VSLETTTKSLAEVKDYLDTLLQVSGLDPAGNGLVLEGRPEVARVGLAVNCSFQTIDGAARRGCDLLVTHHAAWPEIDRHLSETKYGRLRELGIGYYAAHESLDLAREFGTADALARAVRVAVQDAFAPDGETEGIGVHGPTIGSLPEFVSRVGTHLGSEPRRWKNNDSFGHVGLVPGWGGLTTWMARALELGCDTFLTGETNMFGILFAREVGLNLVIAGHYATETPGVMALSARLARDLKVEVTFIPEDVVEESG
jgi:dinuclear metal center YbgI/SA1388 family protein